MRHAYIWREKGVPTHKDGIWSKHRSGLPIERAHYCIRSMSGIVSEIENAVLVSYGKTTINPPFETT